MTKLKKLYVLFIIMFMVLSVVPALAEQGEPININTASVAELEQLYRIGPKYAERIVQYRKDNGPFKNPEDIIKVKGIGIKIFKANEDKITVE